MCQEINVVKQLLNQLTEYTECKDKTTCNLVERVKNYEYSNTPCRNDYSASNNHDQIMKCWECRSLIVLLNGKHDYNKWEELN